MNEIRFIVRAKKKEELKAITIMSGEQIDLSKIRKGWYAHVIYTSEGEEETVTGRITRQDSVHIVIRVREERALKISKTRTLKISKTIAYRDIDTLVISQHAQSIEASKNAKQQVQRHFENGYYTKVRVQAPSIWKGQVVGTLIKMTPDTLVVQRGGTFFELPVSSISNLEVNIGQRNTGKGLLTGLGTGLAVLIVSAKHARNIAEANPEVEFAGLEVALGGMAMCGLIFVIFTLIGYKTKSDKWVEVAPQHLNLSIAPTSGKGLRAALTFNF